jgi:hypothetical protein
MADLTFSILTTNTCTVQQSLNNYCSQYNIERRDTHSYKLNMIINTSIKINKTYLYSGIYIQTLNAIHSIEFLTYDQRDATI